MNITAQLNDYRQSPRKVRLVASLVCGKPVTEALDILRLIIKRSASPLADLVKSAIANAKVNFNLAADDLFIKSFTVDNGAILYRRMPRARGMAYPIRKRTSHITLVLGVQEAKVVKKETRKK